MNWREYIQAAINRSDGKFSMQDIEKRLDDRTAILYCTGESAAVLWREDFPQSSRLTAAYVGGDLQDILRHIPPMREYARQIGCSGIDVYGRPGWARVLKQSGFRHASTIMTLEV